MWRSQRLRHDGDGGRGYGDLNSFIVFMIVKETADEGGRGRGYGDLNAYVLMGMWGGEGQEVMEISTPSSFSQNMTAGDLKVCIIGEKKAGDGAWRSQSLRSDGDGRWLWRSQRLHVRNMTVRDLKVFMIVQKTAGDKGRGGRDVKISMPLLS